MLKGKWDNIKRDTRKKFALDKQETYKTGGGQKSDIDLTSRDFLVKDLIGVSVTGLTNDFDSDGICKPSDSENIIIKIVDDDQDNTQITSGSSQWNSWLAKAKQYKPGSPKSRTVSPVDWETSNDNGNHSKKVLDDLTLQSQSVLSWQTNVNRNCKKDEKNPQNPEMADNLMATTWNVWNPAKLKTPKSAALSASNDQTNLLSSIKKKTQLNQDCRIRINIVSEARLELIKLQMECLKKDLELKMEEHHLQMDNLKEQQKYDRELSLLDIQKKKIELELLRKKLEFSGPAT